MHVHTPAHTLFPTVKVVCLCLIPARFISWAQMSTCVVDRLGFLSTDCLHQGDPQVRAVWPGGHKRKSKEHEMCWCVRGLERDFNFDIADILLPTFSCNVVHICQVMFVPHQHLLCFLLWVFALYSESCGIFRTNGCLHYTSNWPNSRTKGEKSACVQVCVSGWEQRGDFLVMKRTANARLLWFNDFSQFLHKPGAIVISWITILLFFCEFYAQTHKCNL